MAVYLHRFRGSPSIFLPLRAILSITMNHPKTLTDAIRFYSIPANCLAIVKEMRWAGEEPTCPHCDGKRHYWLAKQVRWKCAKCRKQFTAKTGTVFEDANRARQVVNRDLVGCELQERNFELQDSAAPWGDTEDCMVLAAS
jgi:transposase-like protein